jgi:UDP-N-acetylglucosamine--N-acetylmuramyl-(pentapeptide) pyrophosphoryl-undecaprenol N-acetylglucosamine transferase
MVIAGGGTGGHLFPGIAIAQAFKTRDPKNSVCFASTGRPFEIDMLAKWGFKLERVTAAGIKGRGLWNQIGSVLIIPKGIYESIRLLKRLKPDVVVGVGSYASGPVVFGAWLMGIPIVLHEQNLLPGITNRILSYFATRVYVSFSNTQAGLNPKKVLVTGNPVRSEILQAAQKTVNTQDTDFGKGRPFIVLIIGGSQGAHRINMAVTEALQEIVEKDKYFFIHQTGLQDESRVKDAYARWGICGIVKPFFNNMAQNYARADLVICRAGATTVAEVTAVGKAVIFIPYPFAADNHQVLNARALVETGAAEMILQEELSGKMLARKIEHYVSQPEALFQMAAQARKFGKPDAAEVIVEDCYKLICGD